MTGVVSGLLGSRSTTTQRREGRIGVIANRVRKNTLIYQSLMRFLYSLQIPIVATFRDTQNYVRAEELGIGIHEMKPYQVKEDIAQWTALIQWLKTRPSQSRRSIGIA